MKKFLAVYVICIATAGVCRSADIGLLYENEAAVKDGRAILGTVTSEGILTTAKFALANNTSLLVGVPGDKLRKAILLRLDNKTDLALVQLGDEVSKPELQKLFQDKAAAVTAFLPTTSTGTSGSAVLAASAPQFVSTDPFYLKIDGVIVGSDPIELPVRSKKSEFELEVVRPSTVPVWNVKIKITADPKLSFWKASQTQTLNDVPKATFTYSKQIMMIPLANGRSFSVPIEVHYIKEENYVLNFKIESKSGTLEKKVPVHFKSK